MNREEVLERINVIFREVFNNEELTVSEESNSDTIEEWDSLNHINLISAVEKEFGIKFGMDEFMTVNSVNGIVEKILEDKG